MKKRAQRQTTDTSVKLQNYSNQL